MRLERLQVFQRRCLEHPRNGVGNGTAAVAMTLGELDELVHEVFRLRTIIRAVKDVTRTADCETWGDLGSSPSGSKTEDR